MDLVWDVFCEELYMTNLLYDLQIHSFVLMSNHYHLIASTPDANISKCMQYFSRSVSLRLTTMGNRINQTFAGRYFKSILHQPNHYLNTYKYCYRNPVTAKICDKVQDYPYSSLNGKLGGSRLGLHILNDDTLFPNTDECLRWLNTSLETTHLEAIRCAVKRKYFTLRLRKDVEFEGPCFLKDRPF